MSSKKLTICVFTMMFAVVSNAQDKSESERIIADSIKTLVKRRDALTDQLQQARVDKAIRELQNILDESESATLTGSDINVDELKKRLAGKVIYDPKSGELTLKYDFGGKAQLSDFDVGQKRVLVAKKMLIVESGDSLHHIAKFRTATVTATLNCKGLKQVGIGSSTGAGLDTGGAGFDTIYLSSGSGAPTSKIVSQNVRSGSIPIVVNFMPKKISVRFGNEVLTVPGTGRDESHQIVFHGGAESCAFSNVVITGVPDPVWLKEFIEAQ